LSFGVSSAGNPSGPNRLHRDIHKRHVSTGRKPIEKMADQSKVILVSNISYLFSAGTKLI